MNTAYIITADGNISLLYKDKTNAIGKSHPNYKQIVDCLNKNQYSKLDGLLDIPAALMANLPTIQIQNGQIIFRGEPVHNTVASRIIQFMQQGLPYKPLANFLANLMENSSGRSVQELYGFLEHKGFPITEDGSFIAYKGVRNDYMDVHSNTISNRVGNIIKFERQKVDDNCNHTCSYGLHVGTLDYASGHCGSEGRVMLVKVNPRDCVSVPVDHDASKLRVCQYEVIGETTERKLIEEPLYGSVFDPEENDRDLETYDEGSDAYHDNLSLSDNPYFGTYLEDFWRDGWQNAQLEVEGYTSPCDVEESTGRRRGQSGRFVGS